MKPALQHDRVERLRFSLAAVFEYTTLCALLCAFSPLSGVIASVYLMLMALALGAKQGLAALLMLIAASVSTDWQLSPIDGASAFQRQIMVMLLAALICGWYLQRGRLFGLRTTCDTGELGSAKAGDGQDVLRPEAAWHRLR